MSTATQILECAEQELPGIPAPDRWGRSRYDLSLVRQKVERQEAAIRDLLKQAVASCSRDDWDLSDELDYTEELLKQNSASGDSYHCVSTHLGIFINNTDLPPIQKKIIRDLRLALRLQASILDDLDTAEQRSIQALSALSAPLREPFPQTPGVSPVEPPTNRQLAIGNRQ